MSEQEEPIAMVEPPIVDEPFDIIALAYSYSNKAFRAYMNKVVSGLDLRKPNNVNADYLNRQLRNAIAINYPKETYFGFLEKNNNRDGYYLISLIDQQTQNKGQL